MGFKLHLNPRWEGGATQILAEFKKGLMSKPKAFYELQDYILMKVSVEKALIKLRSTRSFPLSYLEQELSGLLVKGVKDQRIKDLVEKVRSAIEDRDRDKAIELLDLLRNELEKIIQDLYKSIQS